MISRTQEQKRLCDVTTTGTIKELNHICGPLYNVRLTLAQIHSMVSRGVTVYEVNPADKSEKTLLTPMNYQTNHYAGKKVEVKPVTPAPAVPNPVQEAVVVDSTNNNQKPKFSSVTMSNPNNNNGKHGKHHDKNRNNYQQNQKQEAPAEEVNPTEKPITEVDG